MSFTPGGSKSKGRHTSSHGGGAGGSSQAEDIYVFKSASSDGQQKKKHPKKQGEHGQKKNPMTPQQFMARKRAAGEDAGGGQHAGGHHGGGHYQQGPPQKKHKVDSQAGMSKKEKKTDRKAKEKNYDLVHRAKQLWEQARQHKLVPEKKREILNELYAIVKGKVLALIFKHDCSRVVQTCLKYGTAEQRGQIALELKGNYVSLSKNTYSRFLVTKVLKYSPKYKSEVVKEFLGHTVQLIRHKEASFVIEDIFVDHATGAQRKGMVAEFFGPEYSLFQQGEPRTLAEIIAQHPEKRPHIMKNIAESVLGSLNKGTVRYNLIHHVIAEYLDAANEQELNSMIDSLKEQIPEIIHTKKGHRVAITALLRGSPKDRKVIVKAMKDFATPICRDSYGHLVIIELFEVVDDTVLVQKNVLAPMIKDLATLVNDKFGRRPLLYLLAGRSPRYLIPQTIKFLQDNDAVRALTSKKDPRQRRDELFRMLLPELVSLVTKLGRKLIKQNFSSEVLCELLLHGDDYRAELMELIASYVDDDDSVGVHVDEEEDVEDNDKPQQMDVDSSDDDENADAEGVDLVKKAKKDSLVPTKFLPKPADTQNIMTHIIANRTLKRLVVADHRNSVAGAPKFGPILLKHLRGKLLHWAQTWGAVVIVSLLESPLTQKEVFAELHPHLAKIKGSQITASQLLASKLEAVARGEDITTKNDAESAQRKPAAKRPHDGDEGQKSAKKAKGDETPKQAAKPEKPQTPKQQTPKQQTPKADAKQQTPRAETPKPLKVDTPAKPESPKAEARPHTPKAETPKAQKAETPKAAALQPAAPAASVQTPGKKQKGAKQQQQQQQASAADLEMDETTAKLQETRRLLVEKQEKLRAMKERIASQKTKATVGAGSGPHDEQQEAEAGEEQELATPQTPTADKSAKPAKTPRTERKDSVPAEFKTPSPLQTRNQRKAKEAPKTEPRPARPASEVHAAEPPKSARKPAATATPGLRHTPPMTRSKVKTGK